MTKWLAAISTLMLLAACGGMEDEAMGVNGAAVVSNRPVAAGPKRAPAPSPATVQTPPTTPQPIALPPTGSNVASSQDPMPATETDSNCNPGDPCSAKQ